MRLKRLLGVWCPAGVIAVCLAGMSLAQNSPSAGDQREEGHTYPSVRTDHRLKIADVVDKVPVKPGDRVKAGQLLLQEDIREELADKGLYELVANSNVDIEIAKAKLNVAAKEFATITALFNDPNGRNASQSEYDKAEAEVKVAELEIEKAKLDKEAARKKVERVAATIAGKQILSRIDGIVEKTDIKEGEVVDPTKPAVTVVKNDPLWVEFKPFSAVSRQHKTGQELEVYYEGENQAQKAKIIFIGPVVEATSDRQLVRLEMPNPDDRPTGLRVKIAVPGRAMTADAKKD